MNAHITVLSQQHRGHKLFCPAVTSSMSDERFMYPKQYRKRSDAIKKAQSLAKTMGIKYMEPS